LELKKANVSKADVNASADQTTCLGEYNSEKKYDVSQERFEFRYGAKEDAACATPVIGRDWRFPTEARPRKRSKKMTAALGSISHHR
jgi:hypothetical protein